jgi:hypothetical protein
VSPRSRRILAWTIGLAVLYGSVIWLDAISASSPLTTKRR